MQQQTTGKSNILFFLFHFIFSFFNLNTSWDLFQQQHKQGVFLSQLYRHLFCRVLDANVFDFPVIYMEAHTELLWCKAEASPESCSNHQHDHSIKLYGFTLCATFTCLALLSYTLLLLSVLLWRQVSKNMQPMFKFCAKSCLTSDLPFVSIMQLHAPSQNP